jgi:hypothetical protein
MITNNEAAAAARMMSWSDRGILCSTLRKCGISLVLLRGAPEYLQRLVPPQGSAQRHLRATRPRHSGAVLFCMAVIWCGLKSNGGTCLKAGLVQH